MKQVSTGSVPAPKQSLLAGESSRDFESMRDRFLSDVKPADFIEEMLANDFLMLVWEISRYRRAKAALINSVRPIALANLLALGRAEMFGAGKEERELAVDWFEDPDGRQAVRDMLGTRNLDESSIEAGAMRIRLREIDALDRMLASSYARRDRVLQQIADYRTFFAQILHTKSTYLIEGDADKGEDQVPGRTAILDGSE